jgi:hypothetical protein
MALAGAVIIARQPMNKTKRTPKKRSRLDPLRFPRLPIDGHFPMGRKRNDNLVQRLAHAIAGGTTIAVWAKANHVNVRSARNWARTPECRTAIADIRQKVTGRVIGKLTRHSLKAVDEIAKIMKAGENGAVRLNAAKAIISALMDVENHSMTMRSLNDLTNRLKALEQATDAPPRKAV